MAGVEHHLTKHITALAATQFGAIGARVDRGQRAWSENSS